METFSDIGDVFRIDSKSIKESRELLLKILEDTVDLDFPKKGEKPFAIRFYQMTREEKDLSSSFCFKAIFGKIEGYCYDFRMLANERYFTFDSKVSFLPIVFSPKRWEKAFQLYGSTMKKVCKQDPTTQGYITGILLWPLYNEERMALLKNSSVKPVLYMNESTFEIKSEDFDNSILAGYFHYYDTSSTNRFFPKGTVREKKELSPEEKKQADELYLKIQQRVLDQIASFNLTQEDWNKFQAKAKSLFLSMMDTADETLLVGTLLTSFVVQYFENQQ